MIQLHQNLSQGLAVDGQNGVNLTLEILRKELDLAMALSGCTDVKKISKNLVKLSYSGNL